MTDLNVGLFAPDGVDPPIPFGLPDQAVTETLAILAVKRAGKSNAGVVLAEELYDQGLPWVAIDPKGDWWGVRAAGDGESPGLSVVVFGGEHGDVPLEPTAGNYVADLIVDQRLTCVLDVSEMTKADQRRFLTDFAARLYRRNREPLHVICEEADEYIPQMVRGESAKLVGAFETLVKRGGFRGIGITLITQRSASLNKDVLTQVGTLIAMRTTSPQDRKAVLGWIDYHATSRDVVDDLPTLADGEAWVFSPAWLRTLTKVRFRRRRTFDSGATPTIGGRPRPPARLADVDLAAIKEAMAETIERAKADDPRELRKQLATSQALLQHARAALVGTGYFTEQEVGPDIGPRIVELWSHAQDLIEKPTEPEQIEVPVLSEDLLIRLENALSPLAAVLGEVQERLTWETEHRGDVVNFTRVIRPDLSGTGAAGNGARSVAEREPARSTAKRADPPVRRESDRPAVPRAATDERLSDSQEALLDALAWFESVRIKAPTRGQVAFQAGVSPKSSGFEKNCSTLRTRGLIDYPLSNRLGLTDGGRAVATPPSTPATSEGLQASIKSRLSESQRTILTVLIETFPADLTRADLADRCQVSERSSGFEKNLSTLRGLGLVDYPATGSVAATELLWID